MQREGTRIGETLRQFRVDRRLSLATVAEQVDVSVATLSRIETNKQGIDIELLMKLARIFEVPPTALLGEPEPGGGDGTGALVRKLALLPSAQRLRVLRASARGRKPAQDLAAVIDELLATVDALRDDLAELHRTVRRRSRRHRDG